MKSEDQEPETELHDTHREEQEELFWVAAKLGLLVGYNLTSSLPVPLLILSRDDPFILLFPSHLFSLTPDPF